MCVMLGAALPAHAQCTQTGEFGFFQNAWRDGNNGNGFFFPNGTTMVVDTDGDGTTSVNDPADRLYTLPAAIQGTRFTTGLSPTREFFMMIGGQSLGGCAANRSVRIYRLDPVSVTMTLVHEDCLPCTMFEGPLFFDLGAVPPAPSSPPVTPQRIMLLRTGTAALCSPSNQATPLLRWYDLTTPGSEGRGETTLGLEPGAGQIRVSPSGYQAFLQHDLTQNPADADYEIINLCPGPNFGAIVTNEIGPQIDDYSQFPIPVARIAAADGNNVVVQMTRGSGGEVLFEAMLPNCCTTGGEPLGACCVSGGCIQTTQANCDGTWTQGVACEDANCPPPPVPLLAVTMTGPSMVVQQEFVDYVLTYRNDGGLDAENVVVRDRIPTAFTFVSAGQGGVHSPGNNEVNWSVGTLPANSGPRTLTLRVRAGCTIGPVSNSNYRITATGWVVMGHPPVVTGVGQANPGGPITGQWVTTTTATEPLLPGAVLRHELTLTNPTAQDMVGIRFNGGSGLGQRFTSLVSGGTGTLSMPFGGGTYVEWAGNLGAGQTTTIILESTVNSCTSASDTSTQLNGGFAWTISTPCGVPISAVPTSRAFALRPPVSASIFATPQAGTVGPVSNGSPVFPSPMQFVRGTPDLVFTLSLTSHTGQTEAGADIAVQLPFSWITSDPPFVGAVPPGFSYEEPSRSIRFQGDIPVGGLSVMFMTRPDVPIDGVESITVQRTIAGMCSVMLGDIDLVNLPELPTGAMILGTDTFFRSSVWALERGVDPLPEMYFERCEVWYGMYKEPNGNIWIAGAPITMFNPVTMEFAVTPGVEAFVDDLGLNTSRVRDIAVDPNDGTLVFVVEGETINGVFYPPALVRYDRQSAACTLITRDPAIQPLHERADLVIDGAGTLFLCNGERLFRIERNTPTPIPDGATPSLNVPHPTYSFGPGAGAQSAQRVHNVGTMCDGTMVLLHATDFLGGVNGEGITVDTTLYALTRYDPALNTITTVQDQIAANSEGQGWRMHPAEFTPQLPIYTGLERSCIAAGDAGEVLIANDFYPYHSIYAIDSAGVGTAIVPAEMFHIRSAGDIVYLNGSCGPSCDADVNCDGSPDQGDVACIVLAVAGDLSCFCQADADFNRDGSADQGDVATVIQVVAGAPCP